MKKKLVLGILFCSFCSQYALAKDNGFILYKTWCGKVVQTVDSSYFDTQKEADDYYRELNIIECGSAENPDPEEHPEQPEQP